MAEKDPSKEFYRALASFHYMALEHVRAPKEEKDKAARMQQIVSAIQALEQSWAGGCDPPWVQCDGVCLPPGSMC